MVAFEEGDVNIEVLEVLEADPVLVAVDEVELDELETVTDAVPIDALVGRLPGAELETPSLGHELGPTRTRLRDAGAQPLGN